MRTLFFFILLLSLTNCNKSAYSSSNKKYNKQAKALASDIRKNPATQVMNTADEWVGTVNFNLRKPNLVILHHTAQNSCTQTLQTFTKETTQVSAHYVICKDGKIYHMLNDYLRAWHAGAGRWGNITDVNSASIGIEIDNDGFEPFTHSQLQALYILLDSLRNKYNIPAANFVGHADIAPTRKNDPNIYFPWQELADKGFGLWWSDTTGTQVPANFKHLEALRIIGYDVTDSTAALRAFRRKFLREESGRQLNEDDRKILYSLYRKYLF